MSIMYSAFFFSQEKRFMLALRSVQGRMDGLEPEKYKYEMLRVTSCQFMGLADC